MSSSAAAPTSTSFRSPALPLPQPAPSSSSASSIPLSHYSPALPLPQPAPSSSSIPLSHEQIQRIAAIFSLNKPTAEECFQAALDSAKAGNWAILETSRDLLNNLLNDEGRPLLHECLSLRLYPIAEGLVERSITIHAKDADGNWPIHYVTKLGDQALLERVWKHNSINEQNQLRQTPLHFDKMDAAGRELDFLVGLKEYRVVIERYEEALKLLKMGYPDGRHPTIVWYLNKLGAGWAGLKDYRKAIGFYEEALKISKQIPLGEDHPLTKEVIKNLEIAKKDCRPCNRLVCIIS